jgi:hypothetical protein
MTFRHALVDLIEQDCPARLALKVLLHQLKRVLRVRQRLRILCGTVGSFGASEQDFSTSVVIRRLRSFSEHRRSPQHNFSHK